MIYSRVVRAKAVSPLRSATAVQDARARIRAAAFMVHGQSGSRGVISADRAVLDEMGKSGLLVGYPNRICELRLDDYSRSHL